MITVREAQEADYSAVYEIHEAAFGQPAEARLVEALRTDASPQISLVAEREERLVGHVFLSPVTVEGNPPKAGCAGLAPLGVLPEAQRSGVGSALVRDALARCPAAGWSIVFLLGDPAYYARFGFVLAAPRGFRYESERFDAAFQVLALEARALDGASGWVRYHDAFSAL